MKTYKSAAYPTKIIKQFIQDNLISMIVIHHVETKSYQINVYRSQKRILTQSGRLVQLNSWKEVYSEKYLDAAVIEIGIEKGWLTLPEKIS